MPIWPGAALSKRYEPIVAVLKAQKGVGASALIFTTVSASFEGVVIGLIFGFLQGLVFAGVSATTGAAPGADTVAVETSAPVADGEIVATTV